jgi:anaerobic magnesium-protoporphyrin IX monomethyl ester cyclase
MKILVINVPTRLNVENIKIPAVSPPLNLACILGMVSNNSNIITEVIDLYAHEVPITKAENYLPNQTFDLIALGGIVTTFNYIEQLMPILRKKYPNTKILIGGAVTTTMPDQSIEFLNPDIAVIGEGEFPFRDIANSDLSDEALSNIKGIYWFNKNHKLIQNPPSEPILNLGELPLPDWSQIPLDIYTKNKMKVEGKKSLDTIYTRGCPYHCVFCFSKMRPKYRSRPVNQLFEEILPLLEKYDINHVSFLDENFMVDKKKVIEFIQMYNKLKCNFTWDFHTRVDNITKEMAELVHKNGAISVGFGIESGSQKMLDAMKKGITVEKAKEAIRISREAGLNPGGTFIFGMIGETKETMWETVKFCNEMRLPTRPFFMTPYPGTELYDIIKDKIVDQRDFLRKLGEASDFLINLTDFSDEELISLRNQAINEMNEYYWNSMPKFEKYIKRFKLGLDLVKTQGINKTIKRIIKKNA